MQSVSSRIWTRIAVFISYGDNHYTTGTSIKLISDVLLWTPTLGRAKAVRPARTYIQQLCEDTRCCPEDLPEAMNDREEWRERVRDIRTTSTTWWWWWSIPINYKQFASPVGWDGRIHWLHLCRGVRPLPNKFPGHDIEQSNGEVPVLLEI